MPGRLLFSTSRGDSARESPGSKAGWFRSRNPVFRFVSALIVLVAAWEVFFSTDFAQRYLFEPHLRIYARLCGAVLSGLGEVVEVDDDKVRTDRFSVTIAKGCDAVEPTGLFIAGVIASPIAWRLKVPGILLGTLLLIVSNVIRIVILFYVGIHYPKAFDMMHRDVSQNGFILLVVLTWVTWALWALGAFRRRRDPKYDAVAAAS